MQARVERWASAWLRSFSFCILGVSSKRCKQAHIGRRVLGVTAERSCGYRTAFGDVHGFRYEVAFSRVSVVVEVVVVVVVICRVVAGTVLLSTL